MTTELEAANKKREDIAVLLYDWIHEAQVTHRKRFDQRTEKIRQTYYAIADRVIERMLQP